MRGGSTDCHIYVCAKIQCALASEPPSHLSLTHTHRILSLGAALDDWLGGYCASLCSPASVVVAGGATAAGVRAVREYNSTLARCGAQICAAAWGTSSLLPLTPEAGVSAPFLVVVETPLELADFVLPPPPPAATREQLSALAAADAGLNERVADAVLQASGVQGFFFYWVVGGVGRLYCRLSAQVFNTLGDYQVLAAGVLAVKRRRGVVGG